MFANTHPAAARAPAASFYRTVGAHAAVDSASPHQLVSMLLAAVQGEIAAARGAIARTDLVEKGRAIGHAVRIVEEGLLAPLDMERGGSLAEKLRDVYQHVVYRMTMANLKSDDAALADCARLLATLAEGWNAIGPQVDGDPGTRELRS